MERHLEGKHGFQVGMSPWSHGAGPEWGLQSAESRAESPPDGLKAGLPESKRKPAVILWSIDGKSEKETQVVLVYSSDL